MAISIILMGVSGSGKTTVGRALSNVLGWPFYDGDDFHSPENVEKMAKGIPLNDSDRLPWLKELNRFINRHLHSGENFIMACSALKRKYRDLLREGNKGLYFVYLQGGYDLIWNRMEKRPDHYMEPQMLQSQFDTLEIPKKAIVVQIDQPLHEIVREIKERVGLR